MHVLGIAGAVSLQRKLLVDYNGFRTKATII